MGMPKRRKRPLNLSHALILFGKLRSDPAVRPEAVKIGQRLVREIQYLHKVLAYTRATLPARHSEYADPARLDTALARTCVYDEEDHEK